MVSTNASTHLAGNGKCKVGISDRRGSAAAGVSKCGAPPVCVAFLDAGGAHAR